MVVIFIIDGGLWLTVHVTDISIELANHVKSFVCYCSRYFIILRVTASKPKFFLMAIIFILETQTRNEKLLGLHEIYHFHFNFNNTEIDYLHSTNYVLHFLLLGVLERYQPIRPLTFIQIYLCTHHPLY